MLQAIVGTIIKRVTRVELSRGVGHGKQDNHLLFVIRKRIVLLY